MEILNYILGGFALASILATISASFYGVRQKTVIFTLKESNDAYKERNDQIEKDNKLLRDTMLENDKKYLASLKELEGRIKTLENIKTPPLDQFFELMANNHKEVMEALKSTPPTNKGKKRNG